MNSTEQVKQALKEAGIKAETEYISDFQEIMNQSVRSIPAVVIIKKVLAAGGLLQADEKKLLAQLK